MVNYSNIQEIKNKIKQYKESIQRLKRRKDSFEVRHNIRSFEIAVSELQSEIISIEIEKLKKEGKYYVLKKAIKGIQKVSKK
jgi:uncharacterized membrane protein (DUF106 family)